MPQTLGRDQGIPQRRKASVQEIAEVVRRTLAGERVKMTHREHAPRLLLPKRRKNPGASNNKATGAIYMGR